jgi:RNA polymerase-binding transcription factor DksA
VDAARRALRLERINRKGMEVAERLAQLLAGQDVKLGDIDPSDVFDLEGMKQEAWLRAFLDQVNQARRRLQGGGYGNCLSCGQRFEDTVLDEGPWIAQCAPCRAAHALLGT